MLRSRMTNLDFAPIRSMIAGITSLAQYSPHRSSNRARPNGMRPEADLARRSLTTTGRTQSMLCSRMLVATTVGACGTLAYSTHAQLIFQDQTTTRFPAGLNEYTNQLSLCDIDGDLDLDIAWGNGSTGAAIKERIFINNGSGFFTDETDARTGGFAGWSRGVEFGDCDDDGDWDLIIAQDTNKRPQLFINDSNGFFANETTTRLPDITMSSSRAQFGDVDNDGDLDLIFCNGGATGRFGGGPPKLFLNDGTGHYADGTTGGFPTGTITEQSDIVFGDVDNDFDLDILLGCRNVASRLWINNGTGVFTNVAFPPDGASYSCDFGDINGDGDLDLISIEGGADKLFSNDGTGVYTNISSEISPNSAIDDNDSRFFDYDNDGDLDYIVASLGSVERIFKNNGPMAGADFTQVTGLINSPVDSSLDVKVGDVTGDGKIDVITAQGESGSFVDRIYINIGDNTYVDNRPPKFIVQQVTSPALSMGPFVVRTIAFDDYTSDRGFYDRGVSLHYSVDDGAESEVVMKWVGNSMWRGVVPAIPGGSKVDYYVTAIDWAGNIGTSPSRSIVLPQPRPCVGDIDGSTDVGIDDLLLVINNWNALGGPADVNGDGIVNIDDLLVVINSWGPC